MCKLHQPIYLIIECHTEVAYCRETDYATALEILHRLNDAEGANRYCLQACYYQEVNMKIRPFSPLWWIINIGGPILTIIGLYIILVCTITIASQVIVILF